MRRFFATAAFLAAFACSDSSGPSLLSTLTFTFTGAGGGTFLASGNAPSLDADPPTAAAWAVGFVDGAELLVAASKPRSAGLVDLAIVRIERTTIGSESIDANCDIDGTAPCTGMDFYLNFNGNGDTGDFFCALTSGTITITELTDTRVKGTFSGTGECFTGTSTTPSSFSVTGGTFDVGLIAPPTG